MLKSPVTVQRLTAAASAISASRRPLDKKKPPAVHASSMTTDASPSRGGQQQPMLASQRAQEQQSGQPEDKPRSTGRTGPYFPLGYKEAAQQWWASVSAPMAERNVLSFIPYLREVASGSSPDLHGADDGADPFGQRIWRSQMVPLSGKNRGLNEYSVERVGEAAEDTLVMLHGYGAGLGFFYKNFEPLTRVAGWKLYALDLLGMGNSTRPCFKINAKDQPGKIAEAENFFVDALEEWRKIRKLEKFTLLGHSLGGYLAVSYALKYPGRLNKLILASPVGIPEDPYAVNAAMPEPEESTLAAEFTQDQNSTTSADRTDSGNGNSFPNARNNKTAAGPAAKPERRPLPSWLVWLWDANVTPFTLVRATGPLGPRLVSGWTSRRFNHLPSEEAQALHTYSYTLFRQKGSGEFALPYLLAPGAFARSPVINRIQDVGRQVIPPANPAADAAAPAAEQPSPVRRETGFPIVMMYGDNDWMDVAGGFAAEEKIKQRIVTALVSGTPEEKRRENGAARVIIIKKAGHHIYLDNPDEFNEVMQKELEETRKWGHKQRRALQ